MFVARKVINKSKYVVCECRNPKSHVCGFECWDYSNVGCVCKVNSTVKISKIETLNDGPHLLINDKQFRD